MREAKPRSDALFVHFDIEAISPGAVNLEVRLKKRSVIAGTLQRVAGAILGAGIGIKPDRRGGHAGGSIPERGVQPSHGRRSKDIQQRFRRGQQTVIGNKAFHQHRVSARPRSDRLNDELTDQALLQDGQEGTSNPVAALLQLFQVLFLDLLVLSAL